MKDKSVHLIPPSAKSVNEANNHPEKRKVAAYARVSTEHEEQHSSYEAQIDYYSSLIKNNPNWEFAGVYSDEGITATSTSKRDGFNKMVQDAMEGKFSLIITKSISRFARNTVDSLVTTRLLKENGVEVYFEKESLWTFDSKCEILLTILSSIAQEESRNISENTKWGINKAFQDGRVYVPYKHFLGYDKGGKCVMTVNPNEAKVVKYIYRRFLEGESYSGIATELSELKIPTPYGLENWRYKTIKNILTNEKYMGDALLQKTYSDDFLSKKRKVNKGNEPQYYVKEDHEAIIAREVFLYAQKEVEKRSKIPYKHSSSTVYSSKIMCGICGCWYTPIKYKVRTGEYKRKLCCAGRLRKGREKCTAQRISFDKIRDVFLMAMNRILKENTNVKQELQIIIEQFLPFNFQDKKIIEMEKEAIRTYQEMEKLIHRNATEVMNQEEFWAVYLRKKDRYQDIKKQLVPPIDTLPVIQRARDKFEGIIKSDIQFDEQLWYSLLDHIVVCDDNKFDVILRSERVIHIVV